MTPIKKLRPKKPQPAKNELPGVGPRINHLRKTHGLTLEDLSKKLGANKSTISQWETGLVLPTLVNLSRIAEMFRVSIEWIVRGDGYTLVAYDALDKCRAHRGPEGEHFYRNLSTVAMCFTEHVRPVTKVDLGVVLKELDGLRKDRESNHDRKPRRRD